MSGSSLLELQDVSFGYGEGQSFVPVLNNVTFCVESGQRIALLGREWVRQKYVNEYLGRLTIA